MANIAPCKTENDFTFVVGNDSYKCAWFVADFLSPRIARLHLTDSTVNEFEIVSDDCEHQFEEFVSFGRGASVEVNEKNGRFFTSVALELGNYELYFGIHNLLHENLTMATFCEQFNSSGIGEFFSDTAIEFLAVHFFEIEASFLSHLPASVLSQMLVHPSLVVVNEDWLYDLLSSQFDSSPDYIELLEHLRFEFMTKSGIEKFVLWTYEHFDDIEFTYSLWEAITKRLSQSVQLEKPISGRYQTPISKQSGKSILPQDGSPLDGIIAHLTRTHGGNVHDRGIVIVSASSVYSQSPFNYPWNAVDL
jgi:hypothetical protein